MKNRHSNYNRPVVLKEYSRTEGFTVLEVLVVLVIVTLISTLLLQSFGFGLKLRSKVVKQLGQAQEIELVESWFRQTVSNLTLKEKRIEEKIAFTGTPKSIQGETLFSLEQAIGVISLFSWTIKATDRKNYRGLFYSTSGFQKNSENEQYQWLVADWLDAEALFSYQDKDGNWSDYWPTKKYANELPAGIMLSVNKQPTPFFWYVRIKGDKKAPIINFL